MGIRKRVGEEDMKAEIEEEHKKEVKEGQEKEEERLVGNCNGIGGGKGGVGRFSSIYNWSDNDNGGGQLMDHASLTLPNTLFSTFPPPPQKTKIAEREKK